MSNNDPQADRVLAEWRRAGYGIWKVTFIVEGYDDDFMQLLPGRLSERRAKKYGIKACAKELDEKPRHVHVIKLEKLT